MSIERIESEKATIYDLTCGEFGLVYDDNPAVMEIWFNHNHSGSGCDNLAIDAFGKELDLEFCRSKNLA